MCGGVRPERCIVTIASLDQWLATIENHRPVLSCPVLSCPVPSRPVLSCPVLSCPVLSCPVLSCFKSAEARTRGGTAVSPVLETFVKLTTASLSITCRTAAENTSPFYHSRYFCSTCFSKGQNWQKKIAFSKELLSLISIF